MSALMPTICAACAELLVSPAITEPHGHMAAKFRHISRDGHSDGEYTCIECESVWTLSFSGDTLKRSELIDCKEMYVPNALVACPHPLLCTRNLSTCPLLGSPLQ